MFNFSFNYFSFNSINPEELPVLSMCFALGINMVDVDNCLQKAYSAKLDINIKDFISASLASKTKIGSKSLRRSYFN
jgi:hypothetical protein